ncbi:DUF3987 domain-containing protein [Methylomicrobium lacus]|uniref:DUF3987 domain-containing protein n=1 Tax=Methylomicrobium lacus TaxID=136992 RepID=UPI0035A87061
MSNLTTDFGLGGFDARLYQDQPGGFDRYGALGEFTRELEANGALISGYAVADGQIHRVKHKDDKSRTKNFWYVLHESMDYMTGCFGHWKDPYSRTTWTSFNHAEMSHDQRQDYAAKMELARVQQEAERKRIQDEVAAECAAEWAGYQDAPETHHYLVTKQIKPVPGIKFDGLINLVVPLINESGEIRNLQRINFDGKKMFTPGGEVKGCFFVIQGSESLVLTAEGLSTGTSLYMASGATVYVAFNAGNLPAVTEIARRRHPSAKLIVCGDNDRFTKNAKGEPMNTGRIAAEKAAKAAGPGTVPVTPHFPESDTESSDFNDQHTRYSIEAVQATLEPSIRESVPRVILTSEVLNSMPPALIDAPSGKANENPFPERLLHPPGVTGRVIDYIINSAIRPQPVFAMAAALQIVAAASLNRFVIMPYGTGLNLFIVIVGATGCGKDHPRNVIKKILNQLETPVRALESIASSPALLRGLIDNRNTLVWLPDEFGMYLKVALSDKGSPHEKELLKEGMTLYSMANGVHGGKTYSEKKHNIDPIDRPFFSLFGATTHDELTGAMSGAQIDSGFLNRILYIETDQVRPPKQIPRHDLPNEVLDYLNRLCRSAAPTQGNLQGVHPIEMTPEALAILDAFDKECDEKLNGGGMGKLWVRGFDNALRVAGIIALGDCQPFLLPQVKIQRDHAELAVLFVSWCITSMEGRLKADMADSEFESLCKKALSFIKKAGSYKDQGYLEYLEKGWMPRSKLMKLMKLKVYELDNVIDYLLQSKQIQVASDGIGSVTDKTAAIYRLSND